MPRSDQRAGALDEPIEIQELILTQDAAGEPIKTYRRVANEYAAVGPISMPEAFMADRTLGGKLRNFTIRYLPWLGEKHRIVWRTQNYNVVSIIEVGRNDFLEVLGEIKE